MIWFQNPPWARWIAALLIVVGALWAEFGTGDSTNHPFAITTITPGEMIDQSNTELRPVPSGLLPSVESPAYATSLLTAGDPILSSHVKAEPPTIRNDWWSIQISIPSEAQVGDEVQLVLLDSGTVVPGVVSGLPTDDPLATGTGSVAVPAENAAEAASAALEGRVAVLVASG